MRRHSTKILFVLCLVITPFVSAQADQSEIDARRQRVLSELQSRKDQRSFMGYTEAKSYQPRDDFRLPPDSMPGFPVGLAAQMIANMRKKEVLVSVYVAPLMLDITRDDAREDAIIDALTRKGVQIIEVGTLVLVLTAIDR
jgi:hypothetical protein